MSHEQIGLDPVIASSQSRTSTYQSPILLLLVGLPASGKTALAQCLVTESPALNLDSFSRKWIRASQDDSPNRRRQEVEDLVRDGLLAGDNVVVDRMNFDARQRAHFLDIARSLPMPTQTWCIILNTSLSAIKSRLESRTNHPTITTAEHGLDIIDKMKYQYRPPHPTLVEGFDRILQLEDADQPEGGLWSPERLRALLLRISERGHREPVGGPRFSSAPALGGRGR
ncbi:AAA domain-domain-containing protein [Kockovaella imperatae]|uniref:AAA domain-domain-containing protein n=1 Tax=Kockovaella imperatae TaxID=4999 RepID=A0A1Y1UIF4_9TREE|nr:AAA domain-domain-containing protein [Kockovaella imperatae]ORX37792.1 AAA domain-domain-containing protein [Kockovaella imperatae]